MVRNNPSHPYQRQILVGRTSSSYRIEARLIGAIHELKSATNETPATLLVLSFRFLPQKRNVRIKSANITLEFFGDDGYPAVGAIAPEGTTFIRRNNGAELGTGDGLGLDRWDVYDHSGSKVFGHHFLTEVGPSNVVKWAITEGSVDKEGVPPYLQTAILMERKTNEVFQAKITVKADASGFSFQNLQDDLMGNEDDWVIFDPSADPLVPDRLAGLDRHDLRSVRLSELLEWRYIIENEDIQQRETIDQTARDLFPKARIADDKSESWFIDLWDNSIRADVREELPKSLDRRRLAKYFSWISEPPNGEAAAPSPERNGDAQQVEEKPRPTEFFNLIARQSSDNNLTNFSKLESLLNEPPAEILAEFVPLPDDFEISRQHDRGGCQVSRDDEKASKLYIIQTPFYSTGFWSLLLYTMVDSTVGEGLVKLSGVIQVDAGVNLTNVFHDIRGLVARYGHHQALLPLQLFMSHYKATEKAFTSIQEEVGEVDDNLFDHLKEEGKLDDASKLYRKLSMNLHKCSMNIAELSRRRKFENELGSCLLEDLKNDDLRVLVQIYLRMSRSRDSDIKSLHGKIESQRNVLYNLITQHDSYLQARLARESLRDSKAMKTLSILTILFLPGAFIATIFSTNMFDFKSKNQQVRIYFAIVIPLTAVLMICWVLWLKNTPERGDEESARRYRRVMSMNWPKEGKED